MSTDAEQASQPKTEIHVLSQELELVRFGEPDRLYTGPDDDAPPRKSDTRGQKRQKERVPQKVLRGAHPVEQHKGKRLYEPGEREVLRASGKQKARAERQGELGNEARERRTKELAYKRQSVVVARAGLTGVGEVGEVEVGRKVVPVIEAVCMV